MRGVFWGIEKLELCQFRPNLILVSSVSQCEHMFEKNQVQLFIRGLCSFFFVFYTVSVSLKFGSIHLMLCGLFLKG